MKESGIYAPGTEFDPNAPWNEEEQEEKEFEITVSQSLSKCVSVITNDYNIEKVSEKHNNIHEEIIDTSETSWRDVYAECDYHTPEQLLLLFGKYIDYLLNGTPVPLGKPFLKNLKEECESWIIDDEEFILNNPI